MEECCLGLKTGGEVTYVARSVRRILYQLPAILPKDVLQRDMIFVRWGGRGRFV